MLQSHFPQLLADESKWANFEGGRTSAAFVKNCPGISVVVMQHVKIQECQLSNSPDQLRSSCRASTRHLQAIARCPVDALQMPCRCPVDALQMPLHCFFPEGHRPIIYKASTGHLGGWPADVPPRNSDCLSSKIGWASTGYLQGIWRWLVDPSSRLIPCKNHLMPEK